MKYISLLRGINVGGQNTILMKDLKELYESLGFENVATFIQSGNVIFRVEDNAQTVIEKIEKAISKAYGFEVLVQLREVSEFEGIIKTCPFTKLDLEDGTKVYITFLDELAKQEAIEKLMIYVNAPEKLEVMGREVYVYCPDGYAKTKLNNNFLENMLKVRATTRAWKSVMRITILAKMP